MLEPRRARVDRRLRRQHLRIVEPAIFAKESSRLPVKSVVYSPLPRNLVEFGFDAARQIPGAPAPPPIDQCANPTITGQFNLANAPQPPASPHAGTTRGAGQPVAAVRTRPRRAPPTRAPSRPTTSWPRRSWRPVAMRPGSNPGARVGCGGSRCGAGRGVRRCRAADRGNGVRPTTPQRRRAPARLVPHKGTFACFALPTMYFKVRVRRMSDGFLIDREASERSLKRH